MMLYCEITNANTTTATPTTTCIRLSFTSDQSQISWPSNQSCHWINWRLRASSWITYALNMPITFHLSSHVIIHNMSPVNAVMSMNWFLWTILNYIRESSKMEFKSPLYKFLHNADIKNCQFRIIVIIFYIKILDRNISTIAKQYTINRILKLFI